MSDNAPHPEETETRSYGAVKEQVRALLTRIRSLLESGHTKRQVFLRLNQDGLITGSLSQFYRALKEMPLEDVAPRPLSGEPLQKKTPDPEASSRPAHFFHDPDGGDPDKWAPANPASEES